MSGYYVQFNIVENSLTENKNAVQKIPAQKEYRNCMNGTAYSRHQLLKEIISNHIQARSYVKFRASQTQRDFPSFPAPNVRTHSVPCCTVVFN
jgi:hypothetical protein